MNQENVWICTKCDFCCPGTLSGLNAFSCEKAESYSQDGIIASYDIPGNKLYINYNFKIPTDCPYYLEQKLKES